MAASDTLVIVILFQPNVAFLYLLKTLENQKFSDILMGYIKGAQTWNWLN